MFGSWRGRSDERGAVMVLIVASLIGLLAFAALSFDVGALYAERIRLHNIADAAALAGVQALVDGEAAGIQGALDCAVLNGLPASQTVVTIGGAERNEVTVNVDNTKELTFAKVIAIDNARVAAGATAIIGVPTAINGEDVGNLMPLGAELPESGAFTPGAVVTLKLGSTESESGNFHILALGGSGGNTVEQNLRDGYQGIISMGDLTDTEPGNKVGPIRQGLEDRFEARPLETFEDHDPDSPRVITAPIVIFDVNGRKPVEIIGFASFFLLSVDGNGQNGQVTAVFRGVVEPTAGSVSPTATNYGLQSIKLIR